ncbi:thiamine pyrophosphate-binding protein [Solirubrobacter soli]|uniref:thiamine pyrophosphate-binding protein n=1 Tax=Solirubrobacter soli TaxID=363832 RepID=UPI000404668F|nr:thiamine pyrophosphate-binding protein [Solirubrobacter soli]
MSTGAQVIVGELERAGVEVCFGLPGVHNLALWEELRSSSIRLVGVRHEQAAAYAADGYARATGRLGVALTTTGPGAANTLGAVGEAWASRSPILVIATDIPSGLRRPGEYRGVLHETSGQSEMFAPVVKSVHLGLSADAVADAALQAVASAVEAPTRPVYLEIATDLLAAEVGAPGGLAPASSTAFSPRSSDLAAAISALNDAQRPLLWVGGGARDAADAVAELAERLGAPVLTTYGAAGVLPPGHPSAVGLPPHAPAAGALWDEADVIVAIGSDLDGVQTQNFAQPQPDTLIAVSLEPIVNYRADVHLAGDAGEVTAALAAGIRPRDIDDLAARLAEVRAEACGALDATALRFLDAIHFAVPADGVLVVDMCIPGYWLAGFHTPATPRRLQVPLGWGTLGYAFPAALGAALAGTGPVVSVSGDGGFLFACGELATMAQEKIPLTAVIVDDGGYGMLRYDQQKAGDETYGVDLHTPDFEAMAAAFGLAAETVDGLDDAFGEALARHTADPTPSVLVARTPTPLVPPPNTSPNWYRRT